VESITLVRDCEVIEIPSGRTIVLPMGTTVRMIQSLGGSYTVLTDVGQMVRVSDIDADALGLDPQAAAAADTDQPIEDRVWAVLRTCYDPEIPVNIVDLGLVYRCEVQPVEGGGYRVAVNMTLTAPGCGMGEVLRADVQRKLLGLRDVQSAEVEVVFDPPWDRSRMSEAALLQLGMF
jgi:probable FeS assembly SUF system protein SufT